MMKLLLLLAAAVPLFGQTTPTCTSYNLSSGGFVASAAATNTTVAANIPTFSVVTQSGCPFVAVSTVSWVHVLPPTGGTNFVGTSNVYFTFDQNTTAQIRSGQILVYPGTQATPGAQNLAFTVEQIAGVCNFSISPTSASVPVGGASGSFTVTTGCAWGASSPNFVSLTAPNGTLGTNPVNYQVAANPCVAPRTAAITITTGLLTSPTFQITQDGAASNFTLSSNSQTIAATAVTNQRISLTTDATCSWNSYTDAGWLHATGPTVGSGPATYVFSADANQGGARTGHFYFQSGVDLQGNPLQAATLTVVQQAVQQQGPTLNSILNAASYVVNASGPGPISPGEIVALFGTNLGPATPVSNTQTFGTTLGGVTVMFGSTAAPLIFVSAQQINAVVPYGLAGSNSAAVTVQYNGGASPPLNVPVQPTTPGIFSYDHSGSGPGAILNNADFSINQPSRPAAVGSVVDIYLTGAGVTVPASKDGALATSTPPFPSLSAQPVTVTIGGISAQVYYAGPAPGSINGLTQIDVMVPSGVKSGTSIPVVVSIGGVASQSNLFMSVQ